MNNKIPVKKVGEGNWKGIWVSKSDLSQYYRCRYRLFVTYKNNISYDELIRPEIIRTIINMGIKFEDSVIKKIPFEEVASVEEVQNKDVLYRSSELVENHDLGIRGIVDLISIKKGRFFPIEIKYHRKVTDTDEMELAFYWLLLQPLRTKKAKAQGYVLLNTGKLCEVSISPRDLNGVILLLEEIRMIKEKGVEPSICPECKNCTIEEDCKLTVAKNEGLTLIHGIAEVRQEQLEKLGIYKLHDLINCKSEILDDKWRKKFRSSPGLLQIKEMQSHAKSWIERKPIFLGKTLPSYSEALILDLEYDPLAHIWITGLLRICRETKEIYQFFADNKSDEKKILSEMISILDKYPDTQIITFYGTGADFPQLYKSWKVNGLSIRKLKNYMDRHLDLYSLLLNNFRFPLKGFGSKTISHYFGFARQHEGMDGFLALSMYNQYLKIPKQDKEKRQEVKNTLLEYNKDDLEATWFIYQNLLSLSKKLQKR